jgi:hypothetical protein
LIWGILTIVERDVYELRQSQFVIPQAGREVLTMATTTLSTGKISKRGYMLWLKARHGEDRHQTIATISRYDATECPIGQYCKAMGASIWNAPKWAQKVREYYADDLHGMTYTAIEAVYHVVKLYGYRYSAIFYGDEEEYLEAGK